MKKNIQKKLVILTTAFSLLLSSTPAIYADEVIIEDSTETEWAEDQSYAEFGDDQSDGMDEHDSTEAAANNETINEDSGVLDEADFTGDEYYEGYDVVFSHIHSGQDFFYYEPENWDILVSNPPYEGKRQIFERALSFNKPFALLMMNTWLNDAAPKQLFMDKQLQLLMFDKRIKFMNNGVLSNKITFSSSYYCYNLLPRDLIIERLVEPNFNYIDTMSEFSGLPKSKKLF